MDFDIEIYRTFAEQTSDHILVTDPEGNILYVNPAFETVTGYTAKETVGKTPRILKSGEHDDAFYEYLWQTISSGETFRAISINKKKDGSLYYEEKTITPIKNDGGEITYFVSLGKDVTEKIEAEQREKEQLLAGKVDSLETVQAIAETLHRAEDFETLITQATEAIVKYTQAPSVAFFLVDESADCLKLYASHGFSKDSLKVGSTLPLESSLSGLTLAQKKVLTSDSITKDKRVEKKVGKALAKQGLQNVISFPLLFQDKALGVVNLIFSESHAFTEQDKETLLTIGKTIGLAIVNARRLDSIQQNEVHTQRRLAIHQALLTAQTQDEVFDILMENANTFPKTAISLLILDETSDLPELEPRVSSMRCYPLMGKLRTGRKNQDMYFPFSGLYILTFWTTTRRRRHDHFTWFFWL